MNIFSSLMAQTQTGASSSPLSNPVVMTIIMVGFIAFFYFIVVRPQNKKRKDAEQMLSTLKKGDKVVSIGGIHGKVTSLKDNEIVVKIDSNAEITFDKSAISKVKSEGVKTAPVAKLEEKK